MKISGRRPPGPASFVLLGIAAVAVFGLSLVPHPERLLGGLSPHLIALHFVAYLVLGFLAVRVLHGLPRPLAFVLAVGACAVLGGLVEILQPLVGRHRDVMDFLADLGGAAAGAVVPLLPRPGAR